MMERHREFFNSEWMVEPKEELEIEDEPLEIEEEEVDALEIKEEEVDALEIEEEEVDALEIEEEVDPLAIAEQQIKKKVDPKKVLQPGNKFEFKEKPLNYEEPEDVILFDDETHSLFTSHLEVSKDVPGQDFNNRIGLAIGNKTKANELNSQLRNCKNFVNLKKKCVKMCNSSRSANLLDTQKLENMCEKVELSHKNNVKSFECKLDQCKKKFETKRGLCAHLLSYSNDKPFACGKCEFSCNIVGDLKVHLSYHFKTQRKKFVCEICKKSFVRKCNLQVHLLTHYDDKPFVCNVCKFSCKTNGNLTKHMITHSKEKPFLCEICKKTFKSRLELRQHMVSHSDLKPFACKMCHYSCKTKGNLAKHTVTHSDVKSLACEICKKLFKSNHELKQHMISHSNVKRFVCAICEISFKQKISLSKHMLCHPD